MLSSVCGVHSRHTSLYVQSIGVAVRLMLPHLSQHVLVQLSSEAEGCHALSILFTHVCLQVSSQEEEIGEAVEPPSHHRVNQAVPLSILVSVDIESTALVGSHTTP